MQSGILYVEDNPADVYLLREAILKLNDRYKIIAVEDGEAALEFLNAAPSLPCLIILDVGLPRLDGSEVLRIVKANPEYDAVPTVVFADGAARLRIQKNGPAPDLFLAKPADLEGYTSIATQILALCSATLTDH